MMSKWLEVLSMEWAVSLMEWSMGMLLMLGGFASDKVEKPSIPDHPSVIISSDIPSSAGPIVPFEGDVIYPEDH